MKSQVKKNLYVFISKSFSTDEKVLLSHSWLPKNIVRKSICYNLQTSKTAELNFDEQVNVGFSSFVGETLLQFGHKNNSPPRCSA